MNCNTAADRTNGFQQVMLRWEQSQPVNAIHIVQMPESAGDARAAAVDVIIELYDMISTAGKTNWSLLGQGPAERPEVTQHQFSDDWRTELEALATTELNRPFRPDELPFRLESATTADGTQFLLLVYRHAVADGRSISLLMQQILQRLTPDSSASAATPPLTLRTESLKELVETHFGRRSLVGAVGDVCRQIGASLRTQRPTRSRDARIDFAVHPHPLVLKDIKDVARAAGVSLHDLLMAATIEWSARDVLARKPSARHVTPGVGTIVDLTQFSDNAAWASSFGQYLSNYAVRTSVSRGMDFAELVNEVARQTRQNKQARNYRGTISGFRFINFCYEWLRPSITDVLLQNLVPLVGVITNMNLSPVWDAASSPLPVAAYYRATCTTPFTPMIVALTTLGDECTLTVSYRPAIYSRAQIDNLMQHIAQRLTPADSQLIESWTSELAI